MQNDAVTAALVDGPIPVAEQDYEADPAVWRGSVHPIVMVARHPVGLPSDAAQVDCEAHYQARLLDPLTPALRRLQMPRVCRGVWLRA